MNPTAATLRFALGLIAKITLVCSLVVALALLHGWALAAVPPQRGVLLPAALHPPAPQIHPPQAPPGAPPPAPDHEVPSARAR